MEKSQEENLDRRGELSDPEEGEIVDTPLAASAEEELEEGELTVEAPALSKLHPDREAAVPKQASLPVIDSAGWNNEVSRRGKEEDHTLAESVHPHVSMIGKKLLEFEQLCGKDYSMEKNRHEKIVGVMFGAMDRVQSECELVSSDEDSPCKTNRTVRRVGRILSERKSRQEVLRRRVERMGIYLKDSPLTANFDEESLWKPFVVNYPAPQPLNRANLVPDEIRPWSSARPTDPRLPFREQMEMSCKRKRVLVTELAESQLFRRLERQDRKRKRRESDRPFLLCPPSWTGSDFCEFGELITTPIPSLPVSMTVYRDLDPDHSPTHLRIQLKDNTSTKAQISTSHLDTLEMLGMEVPDGVEGELVEEILEKAGSVEESSDLRNVENMDKRLSALLYESRIYENQQAVDFVLQVISKLKGETSMASEEKKGEIGKGSFVALNVKAGQHHRRRVIDEIKREVIRGFYREEFMDKAVANTLSNLIRDPNLLDKGPVGSKQGRIHGRNNMVTGLEEERGRATEEMSWSYAS